MRIRTLALVLGYFVAAIASANSVGDRERPNRLIHESSPYLQLHAHNPVDWYPWGEEAFERAREEDKPIFLSVGYSTCYWCHVMERLVFSDPEIAELMNRGFINIKVDREERPDIDEIYMTATQLLTGRGGWPNSVFLTPDGEAFFAGTYFPPQDQGGRPGFPTVLAALGKAWQGNRPQVEAQARRLSEGIQQVLTEQQGRPTGTLPVVAATRAVADLKERFDAQWGGFGGAPKFPSPANLFLLWDAAQQGDRQARDMVLQTLAAMGRGAIFDQLGGGFHRYTLDRAWRIPHFEKMLYDNALLAEILAITAASTGNADLERLTRRTLDFLLAEMRLPNGAFKSAIDAETDGVEGAFYIWGREEIIAELGAQEAEFLSPILGLEGEANFEEHSYTLFLSRSFAEHAAARSMSRQELLGRVEPLLASLNVARSKRPMPPVDDKVLADWNGMAIGAFARAGVLLSEDRYLEAAKRAANFILEQQDDTGIQLHVWRQGKARQRAFLDDYAFLIHGLLNLFEAKAEKQWLTEAERLTTEMEQQLRAPAGGFYTSPADPSLLVRSGAGSGGAIPAGNGVAMVNLLRLADLSDRPIYRARALTAIQAFSQVLEASSVGMPTVALAVAIADRTGSIAKLARPAADELVDTVLQATAAKPGEAWQSFTLHLRIREGWHLNANPASLELLIPTEVTGDLRDVVYPQGEALHLEFAGEPLRVLSGDVMIRGEMRSGSRSVTLGYQACDERRCLPPVTREISVSSGTGGAAKN